MWVLKIKGQTYYVEHVEFTNVTFKTKETPESENTKGSLKFKANYRIEGGQAYVWN